MSASAKTAREVFIAAVKLAPEEWDAYLKEHCAGDDELRQRVRNLLSAHAEAGSFLRSPAGPVANVTRDAPIGERAGTVIGPYKLLQQLGEGGMGTVFMAEQTQPVQRKVALKVIKPGMDSRQVIARFEAERQALAMMDHVNIARVLDAGTTEAGLPYFVMELVHGIPITKYCDDNHLTPRERLELFVPVCQAIQHAHQKGIIHRDIKPSNVMITLYDGKPVAKVIDFGVAKATEQKLTERTLFTQYGTMVGTLEYMSPEQAEMSALGVDTRSDIYSLGVLLYELLTGSTPLTRQRMKEAAYAEILRMIKEEEPPRPSTRLSDSGEALASISANRQMEPAKLTKLMRGELDWIVMKCLEKDRNRRYETANGFAADVQRYLADEPVLACPPSRWYRFRKFARRNKVVLTTAAIVAVALLLGISISIWQAYLATEAAIRASEAEDWAAKGWEAEKDERHRAETAEHKAKERLFEAKVSQAEASQWSGRPGQRFASLAALAEAAQLLPALDLGPAAVLDLRNRAIVSLTRADLRLCSEEQQLANPFYGTGAWRVRSQSKGKVTFQSGQDPRQEIFIDVGPSGNTHPNLSACGRFVALVTGSQEVQVWELEPKNLLFTIPEYGPVAFSPDSAHLVVAMKDGSLQVFNLRMDREPKGAPFKTLSFAAPRANKIVVAPDSRRAAVLRNAQLAVIDLHTGATIVAHEFPGATFTHLTWHPHGKLLAFVHIPKIVIWEPGSANEPLLLDGHPKSIAAIAFHPSGLVLASAGGDGAMRLWDPWTGKPLVSLQVAAQAMTFGDSNVLKYRSSNKMGHVQTATGQECRILAGHVSAKGIVSGIPKLANLDISPDERWLASIGSDGLRLWDLERGNEVASALSKVDSPVVAFDPANGNLVTGGLLLNSRLLYLGYDHKRYELASEGANYPMLVPLPPGPPADAWRPRGPFHFPDPAKQRHFRGAISKDGRWLIKGLPGPVVAQPEKTSAFKAPGLPLKTAPPTLVDRTSGKENLLPFDGEFDRGTQFAVSPDGRRLLTASVQKYYFWQPEPLKRIGVLAREPGTVGEPALAFSPDGRTVALARSPLRISIVDCETLEELAALPAPNPEVLTSLCFSPKGRWLVAGTQSGRIQIWDVGSIRRQLAEIGLDWKLKPWEPAAGK